MLSQIGMTPDDYQQLLAEEDSLSVELEIFDFYYFSLILVVFAVEYFLHWWQISLYFSVNKGHHNLWS